MVHRRTYLGIIHKDAGSDYGISFPDFPGCISAGADPDELDSMAREALQFHVDGMLADGEPIPEPSAFEVVEAYRAASDGVALMCVPVRIGSRAKRINISIAEDLLHEVDVAAREHGMTRSGFLTESARRYLQEA